MGGTRPTGTTCQAPLETPVAQRGGGHLQLELVTNAEARAPDLLSQSPRVMQSLCDSNAHERPQCTGQKHRGTDVCLKACVAQGDR